MGLSLEGREGFGKADGRPQKELGEQQRVNEGSLMLACVGDREGTPLAWWPVWGWGFMCGNRRKSLGLDYLGKPGTWKSWSDERTSNLI